MQRGASYFFGFLITFVVLLLVFVGCGVLSRRRFIARRRSRFDWDMEPWTETTQGGNIGYVPPLLLERSFIKARSESYWRDLVPLAALVVPSRQRNFPGTGGGIAPPSRSTNNYSPLRNRGPDGDQNLAAIARTLSSASRRHSESPVRGASGLVRMTSPTPYHRNPNVLLAQHEAEAEDGRRQYEQGELNRDSALQQPRPTLLHYLNPTSWFKCFGRPWRLRQRESGSHNRAADDEKPEEEGQKEKVVQVAVLIEMPSSKPSLYSQSQTRIPDYQVGVANLPCTGV